jgi:hypothetical protein
MNEEMLKQIEAMSDADKQALLSTQFPPELEKEANAQIDTSILADSLYTFGFLQGERAFAEVDGLDKLASEDVAAHEAYEKEVSDSIEAALTSLGTAENEDYVEMHKEAQAAAALIFEGYSDAIEKLAKSKAGFLGKAKSLAKAGLKKVQSTAKGAAKATEKHVKKHSGKYGLGGGVLAGAAVTKAMEKKSADLTAAELVDIASDVALEKAAAAVAIEEGISKLAARGAVKGEAITKTAAVTAPQGRSLFSAKE